RIRISIPIRCCAWAAYPKSRSSFCQARRRQLALEKRRRPRSRPPSETRSLSLRVHAFAICQSVLKPCEKRSRIGVDVSSLAASFSEQKRQSQLHRARSANLVQRIEAAILAAASKRRSQHLRRLPE